MSTSGDAGMSGRIDRRQFLKITALGAVGLYVGGNAAVPVAAMAVPGGLLDPRSIPKFRTPLLIPPVMPRAGRIELGDGREVDYYEISMRQFRQQVLPDGLPRTTVWGYGAEHAVGGGSLAHHAPSFTIEARQGEPTAVRWRNELVDDRGRYLPHLLPVDPTLHWANPGGGVDGRDTRPTFRRTPECYTGPVPMVTHVHGMAHVGDESDGYAEAWYLPRATNIPRGYATRGTWYDFFAEKADRVHDVEWRRGSATFVYPNVQRATTLWYHDHTLGMTRLNVYAGPAGFYLIRGGAEGDDAVRDSRSGRRAVLPGPAPRAGDAPGTSYYEIPLAIQDRAFRSNGELFYPDSREHFDGVIGPYTPDSDVPPIWNPEFFGNTLIVNGATWPHLEVEQRRYRFRALNGCQARFLILDFAAIPGAKVWQIGNEGGFLRRPVNLSGGHAHQLLMAPAERADLIVDFTDVPLGSHVLRNVGPDEPYGGGEPGTDFDRSDPDATGQVMEFRVVAASGPDRSTPPEHLRLPRIGRLPRGRTRRVALLEEMSMQFAESPVAARLGVVRGDPTTGVGAGVGLMWMDEVTENPSVGDAETWEIYNATGDAHPIHIHEVQFQVVNRQPVIVDEDAGTFHIGPGAPKRAPKPWENGYKDTVIAYPGEVTRVRMRFITPGQYTWHCHIVEHEDNEMMRPYRVGPEQPGQPMPTPMPGLMPTPMPKA
jgi:FtsP/CotA-like multicopper oxidase with cupredoxin domain